MNFEKQLGRERQAAQKERNELEKLSRRVETAAEELKDRGFKFKIEETDNEFVIKLEDREIHVPKWRRIPVGESEVPVEDAIKAYIINPGGSIYDTIHSPEFQKGEKDKEE